MEIGSATCKLRLGIQKSKTAQKQGWFPTEERVKNNFRDFKVAITLHGMIAQKNGGFIFDVSGLGRENRNSNRKLRT